MPQELRLAEITTAGITTMVDANRLHSQTKAASRGGIGGEGGKEGHVTVWYRTRGFSHQLPTAAHVSCGSRLCENADTETNCATIESGR